MMQRTRTLRGGSALPRWRMKMMLWVVALCTVILTSKLFYLQIIQSQFLGGKATAEHVLVRQLDPPRGIITDRNGVVMAENRPMYRLYADPMAMTERGVQIDYIASKLAPIVHQQAIDIQHKIEDNSDRQWISISDTVTMNQVKAIEKLNFYGIGLEPTTQRVYPNGNLASQVLGFVNSEGQASYGVEGEYNAYLTGKPGEITAEQDLNGRWIAIGPHKITKPEKGADVQLTIDSTIQYYSQQLLEKTVKEQQATGGSIIVMNPNTGEILSMANYPNFDPNTYYKAKPSTFTNPAISNQYEPGSTFKLITMATGLATGTITPYTSFNDPGYWNIYGMTIQNWNGMPHPNENMIQVLENSANIGAAWVAQHIGKDNFYRYLQDFGFGVPTGVDLPGESDGMLLLPSSDNWSPINLLVNAYGQGIAVTPLQLITAESTIANGGLLMRPYVVSKITRNGKVIKENKPTVVRRVLSPEVAKTIKSMAVTNGEYGEYEVSRVPGYTVGAKTGTASIPDGHGGFERYTIASFMGFSPAKDTKFIILIKIDKPKKSKWGADVAAPVFRQLAEKIYAYLGVPPDKPIINGKVKS